MLLMHTVNKGHTRSTTDAVPMHTQGMQIQSDQVTIEGTIHQAMIKAGCVPEGGLESFKKVRW